MQIIKSSSETTQKWRHKQANMSKPYQIWIRAIEMKNEKMAPLHRKKALSPNITWPVLATSLKVIEVCLSCKTFGKLWIFLIKNLPSNDWKCL